MTVNSVGITTMAIDHNYFRQILKSLLSENNEERTKAEEVYSNLPIETRILFLLNSIEDNELLSSVKLTACILLRRLLTTSFNDFYPLLSDTDKQHLKEKLLRFIETNTDETVKKKLCDLAAELARNLLDDSGYNAWPEFLEFLFKCANSADPQLRECSLRMFSNVPGIFGKDQIVHMNLIKSMLHQSLVDRNNPNVRTLAVQGVCSFLILHENEEDIQKHFQDLIPAIIQVMVDHVRDDEDDTLLKSLIDLCESSPKFLRPYLGKMIELCLSLLSSEDIDDRIRQLALEVIVTLCETSPRMMRKELKTLIVPLMQNILKMMTDIDDDEEWSYHDELIDEDNEDNNVVAESCIDRIACSLGGKVVLPYVVDNISSMLTNQDWKYRHAALMAISAIAEGCNKHMEQMLPQIMDGILTFLRDQHPRVRFAACNAIGQMSTDFAPFIQKKFHEKIVPALLEILDDNMNARVQAHAGAALVNFCEDCPKQILCQYLDAIMAKLEMVLSAKISELVEKGRKLVLEQMVTTIASVADTAEEQFVTFYDRLMPCLKYIIQTATTGDLRQLRGKTLECISLIGLAVGSEKFTKDGIEVMDFLLKSNDNEQVIVEDDPNNSYLMSAWSRICIVLGKQFEPYLPFVIGPVLKAASSKPEVAILDNDDLEDVNSDEEWQFVSLGEQQNFGIRTVGLEEKVAACEMLVCYARELKEPFSEYAGEVVKLMVSLLRFYFHDGVRTAAAQSLPYLLICAQIKGQEYLKEMWQFTCPELLRAIKSDPENEVVGDMLASLSKCIETLGYGCMSDDWMNEVIEIIEKHFEEHFEATKALKENCKDEDYEEGDEEPNAGEVETTYKISKIAEVIHALFAAYKSELLPYFNRLLPTFAKLLAPENIWTDRQLGLCIFDDLIEYTGPDSKAYENYYLQTLFTSLTDKQSEVRQAAAYGIGILAMHGGESFADFFGQVIPILANVVEDPMAKSEDNLLATENVISAVAKILKYNSSKISHEEVLTRWLRWLPVLEDEDELPHVYGYLCELIELQHPVVIGPNNSNIPHLISVMLEVFIHDNVKRDSPVAIRMINIMKEIQKSCEFFNNCVSSLTPEKQVTLKDVMSNCL